MTSGHRQIRQLIVKEFPGSANGNRTRRLPSSARSSWVQVFANTFGRYRHDASVWAMNPRRCHLVVTAGVPLTDVSKRLGHANPHVTASVYAHALPGPDDLATAAWEKFQKNGKPLRPGCARKTA